MKRNKIVFIVGMVVVLLSAVFIMTGCPEQPIEKAEYTKEDFVLKFKNESGKVCYVEIAGSSSSAGGIIADAGWESSFDFPTVLKTAIPNDGTEKTITVKDVVVSGKTSKQTHIYNPRFGIHVISGDPMYHDM